MGPLHELVNVELPGLQQDSVEVITETSIADLPAELTVAQLAHQSVETKLGDSLARDATGRLFLSYLLLGQVANFDLDLEANSVFVLDMLA